jgi:hypothetical protein
MDYTVSLGKQIGCLQPGQGIEVTRTNDRWVTVERSGDGKVIRFVRHNANGFQVFRTRPW